MDETTLELLRRMREQVRGKSTRRVYAGEAALSMGIQPGYPEFERRMAELVEAGYLVPETNFAARELGVHEITDAGIAAADGQNEA